MKNIVNNLFDFQKFKANKHLADLISETESKYMTELSDDDLENVNAAGDINAVVRPSKKMGGDKTND